MSAKTTVVPALLIASLLISGIFLHCCAAEKTDNSLSLNQMAGERRLCLEDDEISQFAEQLIIETGMELSVLRKFREGSVMLSDEKTGTITDADENQYQKIREIERDGTKKVWHIIDGVYKFPQGERRLLTYLIVRQGSTTLRRAGKCVLSHEYSWFCDTQSGQCGDAIIQKHGQGLRRVA